MCFFIYKGEIMKVNILGTEYTIKELRKEQDYYLKDCDGYTDKTSKTIVIRAYDKTVELDNFTVYKNKVMRHEIIHAFLYESVLHENFEHSNSFGHEETTIDWFAVQFPKMLEVFKEVGCL